MLCFIVRMMIFFISHTYKIYLLGGGETIEELNCRYKNITQNGIKVLHSVCGPFQQKKKRKIWTLMLNS